jgi:choline monooxygenase
MNGSSSISAIRSSLAELKSGDAGKPRTLPPECYTSEEFLELEREEIFRKEWICLGRIEEVPKAGDYFTTELIDEPLIIVRGKDDEVRVLSNVCRHRSSVIAEGEGNAKNFVCPYHAWTYGTDGLLLRAPHMDKVAGFNGKGCRLPEFATEIWHGFIYVNLDGRAKPLAPRLKSLEPLIQNYHMGEMVHQFREEQTWDTNWKSLVENFMEGYHLSFTHYETLHDVTPTRLCKKYPGGRGYTGYESHYPPKWPPRTPHHPDLTDKEQRYTMMFCVYPSHVVALTPDIVNYMCMRPLGTEEVHATWGLATFDPKPKRKTVSDLHGWIADVMVEDKARLQSIRRGLKSHSIAASPLAPADFEGTIWDINRYLAKKLSLKTVTKNRIKRAS